MIAGFGIAGFGVAGFGVALRLSWRGIRRAKGRSALIAAMVGLPVLVGTALATVTATGDVSVKEALAWHVGAADARIEDAGRTRVEQSPDGEIQVGRGGPARPWTQAEVAALLPPGTRLLPVLQGGAPYRAGRWYPPATIVEADLRDPLTRGMFRLERGRPPAAGGEVAVTPAMLEHGVRLGGSLVMRGRAPQRIVGVLEPGTPMRADVIVAAAGSGLAGPTATRSWLADTPRPMLWDAVSPLNAKGLVVRSRAVIEDPPEVRMHPRAVPSVAGVTGGGVLALAGLVVSMIVLQVALLAGPAFAVGLRRRRAELGQVAAQGGDGRHLGAIVLADGFVLGVLSALAGAALGIAAAGAGLPFLTRLGVATAGPFEVPWGQVALVAVLGAAGAVIAAVIPARQAARTDVAAVLGGRAERPRARRGLPIAGVILVLAGTALTLASVLARTGGSVYAQRGTLALVGGVLVTQLGLVALAPTLAGLAAAVAARLPLPLRLAGRDAVRHRGRTAPAIAAVMAATAIATATALAASSEAAAREQRYAPREVPGAAVIGGWALTDADWREVRRGLAARLPGVTPIERWSAPQGERTGVLAWLETPDCRREGCAVSTPSVPVGDVRLLRHLLGRADPEAEAAFAAGKAVVFDPALLRNGSTDLVLTSYGEAGEEERRVVPVPAVAARPQTRTVQAVLPRAAVERAGYEVTLEALIVDPGEHRITPGEEEAIAGDLSRVYYSLSIYVERGPQSGVAPQLLALAVAVALVVLGATFTATGLAAADARHDLAVMHAVGATARTRRAFVAGQAAIISGAGVLLGLLAGLVPGVAAAWRLTARFGTAWGWPLSPEPVTPTIEVPWALLGGGAVGLPLLAMLVAAAFARGRIALPRRIA